MSFRLDCGLLEGRDQYHMQISFASSKPSAWHTLGTREIINEILAVFMALNRVVINLKA